MKKNRPFHFARLLTFFFVLVNLFTLSAQAQQDLSTVKAAQISDAQLRQYLNQAKANGLAPEQVETELLRRGLPQSEMAELKIRIQQIVGENGAETATTEGKAAEMPVRSGKRSVNNPLLLEAGEKEQKISRIFGFDLFSNNNLTFEPDLRMATPKNYVIGPEDELLLNIYGLNISQQNLKVTPDGSINVRYAGIINVAGLSIEAATSLIRSRLVRYYPALNSGQTKIDLALGNIRSIRVVLIGAINRPGTYTLPSLASLFNALYVSGGPAENGSLRNIDLIRNNKVIRKADVYDFLVKGDLSGNVRLEDNDIIRVPFAGLLVTLEGQLNRPGVFELKQGESLMDALNFAGGFKSKAFRKRITGNRYTDIDRQVVDVRADSFAYFRPQHGDEFFIDSLINRFQNRVLISGAVFKPGAYAIEPGMTLKQLINKAQGLKEDVFAARALVVRTRADLTKEYTSVELRPIMNGVNEGMLLQREDSVVIASIFDLRDSTTITINGAVRKPGTYRFEDSLSLKSLILKAGNFSENATGRGIEISRRKRNVDVTKPGSDIVEIIRLDSDKELASGGADVQLMPFDIITIKEDPFYKKQISVSISGEVLMPSVYTLQSREERLSSVIQRAGGLLYTANISGAKLVRKRNETTDTSEIKRLFRSAAKDTNTVRLQREVVEKNTTDVAIDLQYILKNPGSADDITLEEGDELIIPRINNTVTVNGEVFKPLEVMFEHNKGMKDYLSDAGGVTQSGKKSKAFVIYANGRSAQIRKPLGIFRSYPKIQPGASIYVPAKPKREGLDVAKAGILVSAFTALVTAFALLKR